MAAIALIASGRRRPMRYLLAWICSSSSRCARSRTPGWAPPRLTAPEASRDGGAQMPRPRGCPSRGRQGRSAVAEVLDQGAQILDRRPDPVAVDALGLRRKVVAALIGCNYEVVGAERPQRVAKGIVILGEAMQKDNQWPRACMSVMQVDPVDSCGCVLDFGVVGMHRRLDASGLGRVGSGRPNGGIGWSPAPGVAHDQARRGRVRIERSVGGDQSAFGGCDRAPTVDNASFGE